MKENQGLKICNIHEIFKYFILIAYLIVTILFTISMASRGYLNFFIFLFSTIALILSIILVKKKKIKINRKVLIILFIFAIILRISVFTLIYHKPYISDYSFFYENATNFSKNGALDSRYISIFPYLMPYIAILGTFFKVFNSNNYLLVVLLNTIFDLITTIIMYKIFSKKNKQKGIIAAMLWLINPINIVWTTICCPVVIVNCGITCSLYIFEKIKYVITENYSVIKLILLNLLYGVVLGVTNIFRPIIIIMIIATFMYYIYEIVFNIKKQVKSIFVILGFAISISIYIIINITSNALISKTIGAKVSIMPGWTLYLGSNVEYNGTWNQESSNEYEKLRNDKSLSAEGIQKVLKEKAIDQYKKNGISNVKLFIEKFKVLTNFVAGYAYFNLTSTATINNIILFVVRAYLEVMMFVIILLNIYSYKYTIKNMQNFQNMLIYILAVIGIISSHLLVEVSPRYIMPVFPMITVIAAITICEIFNEEKNITYNKENKGGSK